MGLPINSAMAVTQTGEATDTIEFAAITDEPDPQVDAAWSWTGSFTEPNGEDGLAMEGVEVGIAAPSDQDLVTVDDMVI